MSTSKGMLMNSWRIGWLVGLCLLQLTAAHCARAQAKPTAIATATISPSATPDCPSSESLKKQAPTKPSISLDSGKLPGHGSRLGTNDYEYFGKNCHNAANAFARRDFSRNGIVLCDKYGDHRNNPNHPGGHTFNWRVSEPDICGIVEVCFYNWTTPCCYKTKAFGQGEAPNLGEVDAAQACVRAFCGDYWVPGNPVAFPPGNLVEDAGWIGCVKIAAGGLPNLPTDNLDFAPSRVKELSCRKCCEEKAAIVRDNWTPPVNCIDDGLREKIIKQTDRALRDCQQECQNYFQPPVPPTRTAVASRTPTSAR